jgi:iron-sulfur cluster repair protein YtfE (RIC family)
MLATKLLRQQHRHVESVFKQLGKDGTQKAPLLKDLSDSLAAHMAIEQDIFYPAIMSIDPDLVHESYEEHSLAEVALKRLLATDPADESFQARVTATKELIQHHVEEEEEDLFPKVEKKVDGKVLKQLGAEMEARFEEAKAAGFEANVPEGCDRTSSDLSLAKEEASPAEPPARKPVKRAKKPAKNGVHARA